VTSCHDTLIGDSYRRMLPDALNTNQIRNSAGTEVEFEFLESGPGRLKKWKQVAETPSLIHRLTVSHSETGSGLRLVRRSLVRFDKYVISTVDTVTPVPISAYTVVVIPVGALLALTEPAHVLAELGSLTHSVASATVLTLDGTGNGSISLLNGSL
jgi:hypothetical protein